MISSITVRVRMAPASGKTVDGGIRRVKKAIDRGTNPLSEGEMHFICTCCQILKSNEKERIELIGMSASWDGQGKVRATVSAIRKHWKHLAKRRRIIGGSHRLRTRPPTTWIT
jgi:hypothetical protein